MQYSVQHKHIEKLMYTGNKNDYNNYTLGFAK